MSQEGIPIANARRGRATQSTPRWHQGCVQSPVLVLTFKPKLEQRFFESIWISGLNVFPRCVECIILRLRLQWPALDRLEVH